MAVLYMSGLVSSEFFAGQSWNAIYGACSQLANLLVLPIWIIALTLLYFDSRVRKEAYDLELLAREIAPGFYWQPLAQPSAFGYQMASSTSGGREFTQTSPLGLAGYGARPYPSPPPVAGEAEEKRAEPPPDEAPRRSREGRSLDCIGSNFNFKYSLREVLHQARCRQPILL